MENSLEAFVGLNGTEGQDKLVTKRKPGNIRNRAKDFGRSSKGIPEKPDSV
jgi:hypothetical protein